MRAFHFCAEYHNPQFPGHVHMTTGTLTTELDPFDRDFMRNVAEEVAPRMTPPREPSAIQIRSLSLLASSEPGDQQEVRHKDAASADGSTATAAQPQSTVIPEVRGLTDAEMTAVIDAFKRSTNSAMTQTEYLQAMAKAVSDAVVKANQGHNRSMRLAMRQWDSWKAYAMELQEQLVKYEGGSVLHLNKGPDGAATKS